MCELFVKIATCAYSFAEFYPFSKIEIHSLKIDRTVTSTCSSSEFGPIIVKENQETIIKWFVLARYIQDLGCYRNSGAYFAVNVFRRTERDPVSDFLLPAEFCFSPPTTLKLTWQQNSQPSNDSVDLWTGKQLPTHFSSAQAQA